MSEIISNFGKSFPGNFDINFKLFQIYLQCLNRYIKTSLFITHKLRRNYEILCDILMRRTFKAFVLVLL